MKPRRVWADVRAAFLIWSRYPMRIVISFATPAVFMLLLGSTFGAPTQLVLHVVDEDASAASSALLASIHDDPILDVMLATEAPPRDNVSAWMRQERAVGLLWIPSGYAASLATNSTPAPAVLDLFVGDARGSSGDTIRAVVDAAVARQALASRNASEPVRVAPQTVATGEVPYREFLISGMMGLAVLSASLFGMVGTTAGFRYSGLFKKLSTTPFRKSEWLLSRLLFQSLVALLGSSVLLLLGWLVFQPRLYLSPLTFALIVAGALALTGIGLVIATAIRDTEVVGLVASAVYLPMMFLSGTFFPLGSLPEVLQWVSRVLPLTYLTEGLRATMILGDAATATANLAILLGVAAASLILGSVLADWSQD